MSIHCATAQCIAVVVILGLAHHHGLGAGAAMRLCLSSGSLSASLPPSHRCYKDKDRSTSRDPKCRMNSVVNRRPIYYAYDVSIMISSRVSETWPLAHAALTVRDVVVGKMSSEDNSHEQVFYRIRGEDGCHVIQASAQAMSDLQVEARIRRATKPSFFPCDTLILHALCNRVISISRWVPKS